MTGPPHIRFYAGAPLVTAEGYRLGSLCVIDPKPRTFDAESCNLLCNFAEMVVREIEKEKLRVCCRSKIFTQHLRVLLLLQWRGACEVSGLMLRCLTAVRHSSCPVLCPGVVCFCPVLLAMLSCEYCIPSRAVLPKVNAALLLRLVQVTESVELQSQTNSLMRAMDAFNEAVMLVDMKEGRWTVMFTNDAWLRFMGARARP